jgi:hypothetical protein
MKPIPRSLAVLALAAAPAAGAAPAAAPPIAISASPSVLTLEGAAQGTIEVTNPESQPLHVSVTLGNYDIAANGHVIVDPRQPPNRAAKAWLSAVPAQLVLAAGATAHVTVLSHPPTHAEAGDHHALVLLTTLPSGPTRVGIRTRLGVGVLVRMPGPISRKLAIVAFRKQRTKQKTVLELTLRNGGNINERLRQRDVTVTLRRGARSSTLKSPPFDLLPGDRVTQPIAYRGPLRGTVTAMIRIRPTSPEDAGPGAPSLAPIQRVFHVRL